MSAATEPSPGHELEVGSPGHEESEAGQRPQEAAQEDGEFAEAAARSTNSPPGAYPKNRCTYPDCGHRIWADGERYCRPHHKQAEAWLKEERRRDLYGEDGLNAMLTYKPLGLGGATYPWADWDWDDPLGGKPDDFGDWDDAQVV